MDPVGRTLPIIRLSFSSRRHCGKDQGAEIRMEKLTARYPVRGEICLKELTLTIRAGEKVGIVGRTGAGKSSMALLLFRLLDRIGGTLTIDAEEVSKINLARHRSRITIIPQVRQWKSRLNNFKNFKATKYF